MKFLFPIAVLAAAGVSAQNSSCDADYIVTRCLETEQAKVDDCNTLDYECLCAGHEAVATCYNNCPNDPRAHDANNLVTIHCQNASLYGTRAATRTSTAVASRTTDVAAETTTSDEFEVNDEEEDSSPSPSESPNEASDDEGAAAGFAGNTWSVLLAVAGVVAALF